MMKQLTVREMITILENMDPMASVEGLRDAHFYQSSKGTGIAFVKTGRHIPAYELRRYLESHTNKHGYIVPLCGNNIPAWISCPGFQSDIAVTDIQSDGTIKVLTLTEIEEMSI